MKDEDLVIEEYDENNDITYSDITLRDWEENLTVKISLPCNLSEINLVTSDLLTKYQKAYNIYSNMKSRTKQQEYKLNIVKTDVINELMEKHKGVSGGGRITKDQYERTALADDRCKDLYDKLIIYDLITEFFEHHKTKLEKSIQLVVSLQYSIRGSDKNEQRQEIGGL